MLRKSYFIWSTKLFLSRPILYVAKKKKKKKLIFSFEENLHGQITHIMNRCSSAPNDE
jgi:hypothetical protein